MKTKKTSFLSKFDRLCKEALEDDNLFADEGDDVIDDYDSDTDEIGGEEESETTTYTVNLSEEEVSVLRSILGQVDEVDSADDEFSSDEGGNDEFDAFGDDGITDIEELEREAVEFEKAPDAESARNRTKSGKASTKTGDLDKETSAQDTEEKQYKFVKREKPQELKHKTTKGS